MDTLESVYGSRGLSRIGSKRSHNRKEAQSLTFDPFFWESGDHGGGAWIPPTPPSGGSEGIFDLAEGPVTAAKPRASTSPAFTQSLMLASRDKESLLEEIIGLKRMLIEHAFYLQRDKVHASTVLIENRKLENDIKDMEMAGMPSYKANSTSQIRAKLQGMKLQNEELQNVCDSQHEEITELRRDVRISHTREIEMERDMIVEEISKLHKDVKKLKSLHSQLCCENKELCRIRDKAGDLEAVNHHLENCMEVVNKALEKAKCDVVTYRQRVTETGLKARRNLRRYKDLEEEIAMLKEMVLRERKEKKNLEENRLCLEDELSMVELKLARADPSNSSLQPTATTPPPPPPVIPPSKPKSARSI